MNDTTQWSCRKITAELSDFIGLDLTEFADLLSERAFGTLLVSNINYAVVGVTDDGELVIEVSGYIVDEVAE
jgi:hypothetical protein